MKTTIKKKNGEYYYKEIKFLEVKRKKQLSIKILVKVWKTRYLSWVLKHM